MYPPRPMTIVIARVVGMNRTRKLILLFWGGEVASDVVDIGLCERDGRRRLVGAEQTKEIRK